MLGSAPPNSIVCRPFASGLSMTQYPFAAAWACVDLPESSASPYLKVEDEGKVHRSLPDGPLYGGLEPIGQSSGVEERAMHEGRAL